MKRITVPDIGDFKNVPVIEVLVVVGDVIAKDQPIAVLESDKAVMEIPSSEAGTVAAIDVEVGDRVSAGSPLLSLHAASTHEGATPIGTEFPAAAAPAEVARQTLSPADARPEHESASPTNVLAFTPPPPPPPPLTELRIYAGPAVRKLARELGVKLHEVRGSGPRGRIVRADVHGHVKSALSTRTQVDVQAGSSIPFSLLPWPKIDYGKFGPIDAQPLARIRKISGANLHRNWLSIPHVTNHDDADVTDLENFRSQLNQEHEKQGLKLSPLAFIVKACAAVLKSFPEFNSSLDGETLILKRYYHIGFAADTPNGLLVPVIRDADRKSIVEIAREMVELSEKARSGKLASEDMQGGTFSISSLGGIGGSYFTPIINAPEVAILGVGKMQTRVTWSEGQPKPRTYLPLSLSWDHRVVDGAAAGRFNAHLVKLIGDVRRMLL